MARPSNYTQAIAAKFLDAIASGKSMNIVCENAAMPHRSTVFRWIEKHPSFRDNYTRACEERREVRKEQLFDIPLDITLDPQRARLLSDNIKWVLAKEEPKKYGDKVQHADAEGEKLPATTFVIQGVAPPSRADD